MAEVVIVLERRGNSLKPRQDDRTKGDVTSVPQGSTVMFRVEGADGTTIDFPNGNPFDVGAPISYGPPSRNVRPSLFVEGKRTAFRYRCHGKGPNGEPLDSEDGGGEIEIVKN